MAKKAVVDVRGMSCASCVNTVRTAIAKTPGVINVEVNLATDQAFIEYEEDKVDLVQIAKNVSKVGYALDVDQAKANEELERIKEQFIAATLFMVPVTVLMILHMSGLLMFPHMDLLELMISGLAVATAGQETVARAFKALLHGQWTMDVLIAFGVIMSVLSGAISLVYPTVYSFASVGAMILFFNLLGKYLETSAKKRAAKSIRALLDIRPQTARIIVDGVEVEVPIQQLDPGDIMVVRPGERIPTDGVLTEGESYVDESMITGESMPVQKEIGQNVIGGSVNLGSPIKVKATKVGEDTFLSQLIDLVQQAQAARMPIQDALDKVIAIFVPTVISLAAFTFVFWLVFPQYAISVNNYLSSLLPWVPNGLSGFSLAAFTAIATLVIACPCALGLATPTAVIVASGLAARNGAYFKDGSAFQRLASVNTVVFDKTGTLTKGKPTVRKVTLLADNAKNIMYSMAKQSHHPLSKSITEYFEEQEGLRDILPMEHIKETPGLGVIATLNGKTYALGKAKTYDDIEPYVLPTDSTVALYDETDQILLGVASLTDPLREDAIKAVEQLKKMGIKPVLLSGDREEVVAEIASTVGIDTYKGGTLPQDKMDFIKELKEQNPDALVAMVGDGINDAPALRLADIGIAMGSGTDVAIESGDIVLYKSDIDAVVKTIKIAQATKGKITQNLFWAFFYNVLALPLAMVGAIHPVIAEIAMAFSSVTVVTNSLRLNRIKL
ncbi:heavy metal translocating P-type ATPase [Coprothermobacter platensis]|uniref:heavy metal translocating P-type ATPase n=1 Tax=Coprothermobacter platensis TaxID=108819 RepID=UPI000378CC45|nr:cation-translocating P-type ATPase [Coprothermobacter platensis]